MDFADVVYPQYLPFIDPAYLPDTCCRSCFQTKGGGPFFKSLTTGDKCPQCDPTRMRWLLRRNVNPVCATHGQEILHTLNWWQSVDQPATEL